MTDRAAREREAINRQRKASVRDADYARQRDEEEYTQVHESSGELAAADYDDEEGG